MVIVEKNSRSDGFRGTDSCKSPVDELRELVEGELVEGFEQIDSCVRIRLSGKRKHLLETMDGYSRVGWFIDVIDEPSPDCLVLEFRAGSPLSPSACDWKSPRQILSVSSVRIDHGFHLQSVICRLGEEFEGSLSERSEEGEGEAVAGRELVRLVGMLVDCVGKDDSANPASKQI